MELLRAHQDIADIAEIRLDLMPDPNELDLELLIKESTVPLIFTNRAEREGGNFKGSEQERIETLKRAVEAGARFIDIELSTENVHREEIRKAARRHGTKIICSYHDFAKTPPLEDTEAIFSEMSDFGADIAKIVTMAQDELDFLRVAPLYIKARAASLPLICFCMGEKGRYSRIFCMFLGAFLTFASPLEGLSTAPGQIPIKRLHRILGLVTQPKRGC